MINKVQSAKGKVQKGFTLIEILIVLVLFAVISVVATQSIFLSIRGSGKSQAQISLREDLDYALAVIERNVRNSDSVSCTGVTTVTYDATTNARFFCNMAANVNPKRLEWDDGSGTLKEITPNNLNLTGCSFTCTTGNAGVPDSVTISLEAVATPSASLEDAATVSVNTSILLRTY